MNPFRTHVPGNLFVGTAGWSVPQTSRDKFPDEGTQLGRYSAVLKAAEINSSFHRSHMTDTYQRWALSVPEDFRFSVKLPKTITHAARLAGFEPHLDRFVREISGLGAKLGCILVQLPPSLEFDRSAVEDFFARLGAETSVPAVVEPRHRSWFTPDATRVLFAAGVSRVAADPAIVQAAAEPGASPRVVYFRLHGSPQVYASPYTASFLDGLAFRLRKYAQTNSPVWCVFDNTMRGEAAANAVYLDTRVALEEMGAGR